jgi:hypothetical protein
VAALRAIGARSEEPALTSFAQTLEERSGALASLRRSSLAAATVHRPSIRYPATGLLLFFLVTVFVTVTDATITATVATFIDATVGIVTVAVVLGAHAAVECFDDFERVAVVPDLVHGGPAVTGHCPCGADPRDEETTCCDVADDVSAFHGHQRICAPDI